MQNVHFYLKGTVSRDFLLRSLKITLGSFRIFSKIRGDIRKYRCTTGINDTGSKFATGVNDTGAPVANLPQVSTTPVHLELRISLQGIKKI
jgi:hypothetical protein